MRYRLVAAVNQILRPLGARMERLDAPQEWEFHELQSRYRLLASQLSACLEQTAFPELPPQTERPKLVGSLAGTSVAEAYWIISELHRSLSVDGDVCEFGTAEGATSAVLANEILPTKKSLWLFDSFEGLPRPTEHDELIDDIFDLGSMEAYEGKMKYAVDEVAGRVAGVGFPTNRTEIVPGFIEETVHGPRLPEAVCFAYVDFDFYEPILTALNFLATRMRPGAGVVVDDYDYFSSGAKKATDEFVESQRGQFTINTPPGWAGHFAILRRVAGEGTD